MSAYYIIVSSDFGGRVYAYTLYGLAEPLTHKADFHDESACRRDAHMELAARDVHIPLSDIKVRWDGTLS